MNVPIELVLYWLALAGFVLIVLAIGVLAAIAAVWRKSDEIDGRFD